MLEVTEVTSDDESDDDKQNPLFFDNNKDVTEATKVGQHTGGSTVQHPHGTTEVLHTFSFVLVQFALIFPSEM